MPRPARCPAPLPAPLQALPNWSLLVLAGHPVALMVPNCADVPEIRTASSAKARSRLQLRAQQASRALRASSDSSPSAARLQCARQPSLTIPRSAPSPLPSPLNPQSDEELKRLSGQGVVVADIKSDETSVRPDAHYLADDGAGRVSAGSSPLRRRLDAAP